jgi:predicted small secreted protein
LIRKFTPFVVVVLSLLLSACATLLGPRDIEIPLAKLQQSMDRKFPFNNRYLEILDVRVSNPQLTLQPETNRITTSMEASIGPTFVKKSWTGNLAVSGQLRFDPTRSAVVLAEPRVETFNVGGLDPQYANQIARVGGLLVEQLLNDMPLYTFRPEELRIAGADVVPTKITTRQNSLVVTFEPAK